MPLDCKKQIIIIISMFMKCRWCMPHPPKVYDLIGKCGLPILALEGQDRLQMALIQKQMT